MITNNLDPIACLAAPVFFTVPAIMKPQWSLILRYENQRRSPGAVTHLQFLYLQRRQPSQTAPQERFGAPDGKSIVFGSDKDAKTPYEFNIFTAPWNAKR